MKRAIDILGLLGAAVLIAMLGMIIHAKRQAPRPLAIDDPQSGQVMLWPGQISTAPEDAPAPEMRAVPCELGPRTIPILPENRT